MSLLRRILPWMAAAPMVLIAASTIYPMLFALNIALKPTDAYVQDRFGLTLAPTLTHFAQAWATARLGSAFLNSTITTGAAVVALTLVCSLAGFAFAQLRFRGAQALFFVVLAGLMVPVQVIMVPFYRLMIDLQLLNTHLGLSLAYVAFNLPFGVYLMRAYYSGVPREILEAARLDGASLWQSYLWVMLPLGRPALVSLAIMNTLFCWNDLLLGLLLMQRRELRTVMAAVAGLRGEFTANIPLLAAGLVMAALPVVLVFLLFQRQLSHGVTVGAVKG